MSVWQDDLLIRENIFEPFFLWNLPAFALHITWVSRRLKCFCHQFFAINGTSYLFSAFFLFKNKKKLSASGLMGEIVPPKLYLVLYTKEILKICSIQLAYLYNHCVNFGKVFKWIISYRRKVPSEHVKKCVNCTSMPAPRLFFLMKELLLRQGPRRFFSKGKMHNCSTYRAHWQWVCMGAKLATMLVSAQHSKIRTFNIQGKAAV